MPKQKTFEDYKVDSANWITLATGEYYPDILPAACDLYEPIITLFGELLKTSESSSRLFRQIMEQTDGWTRIQLTRVFRKYVSPSTPVEMLKRKTKVEDVIREFGVEFRPVNEVQRAYNTRPKRDEALCALLWEYKDRGKKGYDLTERFFEMVRATFPDLTILGPERAGKDILIGTVFSDFPHPNHPADFVICDSDNEVLAIGFAHYDSDRGGGQEDDRTGQYRNIVNEILDYSAQNDLSVKVILLNDGPGLLLGSMWDDYASIESETNGKGRVMTLRMVSERLTIDWLRLK